MNITKTLLGGVAFSAMILATSCSALSGIGGAKKVKEDKKEEQQEAVLPRDREQLTTTEDLKTYTSEDIKRGVVKGDWAIETVNGKVVVGEKAPYLRFSPVEKRVYGNNGCNYINGPYQYDAATKTISFGDMASTMMMCSTPGLTDYEINQALAQVRTYDWKALDNEYYLYFYNETGDQVMSLMHQNFDFLNGTWLVKQIDTTDINDPEMKMVIDVDEGKVHGNTGCNLYNGSLEIDMEEANSISFSSIAVTKMACPDPNHETELLYALEEASTAKPISKDEVIFFNARGKQVLKLVRTTDE
ncbi:MAG: META domain-containing protein [Bacteroidales bacterium]|nr:META domain-containing protein [Bacteroidales bacterium]